MAIAVRLKTHFHSLRFTNLKTLDAKIACSNRIISLDVGFSRNTEKMPLNRPDSVFLQEKAKKVPKNFSLLRLYADQVFCSPMQALGHCFRSRGFSAAANSGSPAAQTLRGQWFRSTHAGRTTALLFVVSVIKRVIKVAKVCTVSSESQ
ncbi:MAG: hypothetical protein AAFU71_13725 [Cyanobacteria bacterium J06632_22]